MRKIETISEFIEFLAENELGFNAESPQPFYDGYDVWGYGDVESKYGVRFKIAEEEL